MNLRPIERGVMAYRRMHGLPELFHVRLKYRARTLCVLQGETLQEAHARAERLVESLLLDRSEVEITAAA